MNSLFLIKPKINIPKQCAIVGSSKSLLNTKLGKEIDSFDFIVRFNCAEIKNYEDYVGTKTNLMVVNNQHFVELETLKKNYKHTLFISPFKLKKEKISNISFFETRLLQYFLSFRFFFKYEIFIELLKILNNKKNFSVGFCFILISVISKVKPVLYGFDLKEDMKKRKHYYQNVEIGNIHDLGKEHEIIKILEEKKLVIVK